MHIVDNLFVGLYAFAIAVAALFLLTATVGVVFGSRKRNTSALAMHILEGTHMPILGLICVVIFQLIMAYGFHAVGLEKSAALLLWAVPLVLATYTAGPMLYRLGESRGLSCH